jgi:hypothetical protein
MSKIILMNIGTEHALSQELGSSHSLAKSAWRNTWFADEGDIIISPVAIEEDFLKYIGHILGFDSNSLSVITQNQLVTDDFLLSTDFIDDLRSHLSNSNSWMMMPCFYTKGVTELESLVGIENHSGFHFAAQCGCDLLNRKTHFRQLSMGARVPLADGSVVHTPQALAKAIEKHLPQTGTVIVKKDNAAGGMGNITLTSGAITALPGSRETRYIDSNTQAIAADLWAQLTEPQSPSLVVESYHNASHRFYFEYWIDDHGSAVFLNSGTIRLRPDSDPNAKELVWVGLDIPAELPSFSSASALTLSMQFAKLAAQIGYRGPINIDAIVTSSGDLIFNESNARWGGGLVLHTLGERLLGKQYANHHVLSSLRDVKSPPKTEVLDILREHSLLFNPESKEGVIVLAYGEFQKDTMECLLLGSSRPRVCEIEALLRAAVEQ